MDKHYCEDLYRPQNHPLMHPLLNVVTGTRAPSQTYTNTHTRNSTVWARKVPASNHHRTKSTTHWVLNQHISGSILFFTFAYTRSDSKGTRRNTEKLVVVPSVGDNRRRRWPTPTNAQPAMNDGCGQPRRDSTIYHYLPTSSCSDRDSKFSSTHIAAPSQSVVAPNSIPAPPPHRPFDHPAPPGRLWLPWTTNGLLEENGYTYFM